LPFLSISPSCSPFLRPIPIPPLSLLPSYHPSQKSANFAIPGFSAVSGFSRAYGHSSFPIPTSPQSKPRRPPPPAGRGATKSGPGAGDERSRSNSNATARYTDERGAGTHRYADERDTGTHRHTDERGRYGYEERRHTDGETSLGVTRRVSARVSIPPFTRAKAVHECVSCTAGVVGPGVAGAVFSYRTSRCLRTCAVLSSRRMHVCPFIYFSPHFWFCFLGVL
jgi:hypothetical protein